MYGGRLSILRLSARVCKRPRPCGLEKHKNDCRTPATVTSDVAVIEVQSFAFTYRGADRPAVRDVSFAVHQREIFGFLGPSGAGKSTTQNVLIRLLDGYEGQIRVLGRDLRAWGRNYYRRIGVAFEAPNHYSKLTALENLQLLKDVALP